MNESLSNSIVIFYCSVNIIHVSLVYVETVIIIVWMASLVKMCEKLVNKICFIIRSVHALSFFLSFFLWFSLSPSRSLSLSNSLSLFLCLYSISLKSNSSHPAITKVYVFPVFFSKKKKNPINWNNVIYLF